MSNDTRGQLGSFVLTDEQLDAHRRALEAVVAARARHGDEAVSYWVNPQVLLAMATELVERRAAQHGGRS